MMESIFQNGKLITVYRARIIPMGRACISFRISVPDSNLYGYQFFCYLGFYNVASRQWKPEVSRCVWAELVLDSLIYFCFAWFPPLHFIVFHNFSMLLVLVFIFINWNDCLHFFIFSTDVIDSQPCVFFFLLTSQIISHSYQWALWNA